MNKHDKDDGIVLTEAQKRARRSRSIAIALALGRAGDPVLRHDPGERPDRAGAADMTNTPSPRQRSICGATWWSPPAAACSSPAWWALPLPRCRSTACSAAPPALPAPRRSRASRPGTMLGRELTVRFDSNVAPGLPWRFEPEQNAIKLHIGEVATVHYKVINEAARSITAQASYNVTPPTVGAYFDKINCFCFTEQTMKPGETREMTVVFYVDPAIVKDTTRTRSTPSRCPTPSTGCPTPNSRWPKRQPSPRASCKRRPDDGRRSRQTASRLSPGRSEPVAGGRRDSAPSSSRSAPSAGCITCSPRRRWCSASASSACSTPSSPGGAT